MSVQLNNEPRPDGEGSGGFSKGLLVPQFAQVNLLPTDMRDARKDAMVKRLLLVVLAAVVALSVFIFIVAAGMQLHASNKLDEAVAETAKLQKEKMGLIYVTETYDQLKAATLAELVAMSPEVDWKTQLDAITGTIPDEQSVLLIEAVTNTATQVLMPGAALQKESVGTVTF